MHRNQFVNRTMEMFEKSWSNVDAIRNGITDVACVILGLYEIISLGIVNPGETFTFQTLTSYL